MSRKTIKRFRSKSKTRKLRTRKLKTRKLKTRKLRKGGSALRISPELLKKVVNTYKRHKNMSQGDIRIKQRWFKGYHNQKVRNLSMKNSNSDDYDENVEVINTSGPEWEPVYGNVKDTRIPNVILPERKKKKTQFIRISSSYPKKNNMRI